MQRAPRRRADIGIWFRVGARANLTPSVGDPRRLPVGGRAGGPRRLRPAVTLPVRARPLAGEPAAQVVGRVPARRRLRHESFHSFYTELGAHARSRAPGERVRVHARPGAYTRDALGRVRGREIRSSSRKNTCLFFHNAPAMAHLLFGWVGLCSRDRAKC